MRPSSTPLSLSDATAGRRPWEAPALVVIDAKETENGAFSTPIENTVASNPPTSTFFGSPPS